MSLEFHKMTITVHAKHCYKDLEKLLSMLEILEIYLRKDWNHLTIETMSSKRKFFLSKNVTILSAKNIS